MTTDGFGHWEKRREDRPKQLWLDDAGAPVAHKGAKGAHSHKLYYPETALEASYAVRPRTL